MYERDHLLNWLDNVRAEMESIVVTMDPDLEISPNWTLKSVLAHIAGWEEIVLKSLRAYSFKDSHYLLKEQDIDRKNAEMVARVESLNLDEVIKSWELTRTAFKQTISSLSEEDLNAHIIFPWGPEGEIGAMIAIIAEHEGEHAGEIRAQIGVD